MNDPSCFKAIERAWEKMALILFSPFSIVKWFLLGLSAWLASMFEDGGGGFSYFFDNPLMNRSGFSNDTPQKLSNLFDNLDGSLVQYTGFGLAFWCVAVGLAVLMIIVITVLLLWVKSRCEFIFLDNCVRNQSHFSETWGSFKVHGNSLFLWRVCFCVFALVFWLAFVAALIVALVHFHQNLTALTITIACAVLLAIPLAIVFALTETFLKHFVVPIMYKRSIKVLSAWAEFLKLIRSDVYAFARFIVALIVLRIATAIFMLFLVFSTCCCCCVGVVFLIPYISSVIILPLTVFFRLYGVEFISQFSGYDTAAPAENQAAAQY